MGDLSSPPATPASHTALALTGGKGGGGGGTVGDSPPGPETANHNATGSSSVELPPLVGTPRPHTTEDVPLPLGPRGGGVSTTPKRRKPAVSLAALLARPATSAAPSSNPAASRGSGSGSGALVPSRSKSSSQSAPAPIPTAFYAAPRLSLRNLGSSKDKDKSHTDKGKRASAAAGGYALTHLSIHRFTPLQPTLSHHPLTPL